MEFLTIGSTVVDTFIKLKEAQVHCDIDNEHCTITMGWGDKIPFEGATRVPAVGNAPNAAVAAARLGLTTGLLSVVGHDRDGADCLERFAAEGIATEHIEVKEGVETSNNYVLWYDVERTILVRDAAFELKLPSTLPAPRAVYLSRIGDAGSAIASELADWLEQAPGITLAFQPGTAEIKAGLSQLKRLYARTDIFIANKEEYQRILGTLEESPKLLMQQLRAHGPKTAFLTDGPKGAYALDDTGAWSIGLYPDGKHPYERTGAGDAFSATAVVALLRGKSLPEALAWGPINSAFVVQQVGAQAGLLTLTELEERLRSAPSDYKALPL